MTMPSNHAVLIGVNDYSLFDRSLAHPVGSSDLPGSINDALVFYRMCRQLGIPAENIRILTSPMVDFSLLDGATKENVGEATEAAILDAAAWLAEKLAEPSCISGFFTYSGHGDWMPERGLVLCPSNTEGTTLEHSIPLAQLQTIFASKRAAKNLTMLLDTCHSAARSPTAARLRTSLTERVLPEALADVFPLVGSRVLAACGPRQTAFQARFSGVYRGAFSWAVSAVVEQWQSTITHGTLELDISYSELLHRASALLDALSFGQTPILHAPVGVGALPVFHTGPLTAEDQTSEDPNAKRYGGQLDPDCKYSLVFNNDDGQILSTGATIGASYTNTYNPNTEYWSLPATLLNALVEPSMGAVLTLTKTQSSINWQNLGFPTGRVLPTFNMPNTTVWTKMPSTQAPPNAYYNTTIKAGLVCNLQAPSGTAPWRGTMTWYLAVTSTNDYWPGTGAGAGGQFTYGERPALGQSQSWYFVTLPPLNWATSSAIVDIASTAIGVGSTCSATSSNTSLQNKVWLAYTTSQNAVHVRSSTDGTSYSSGVDTNASANSGPAVAITDGSSSALYIAYREVARSTEELHIRYSTNGVSFSSVIHTSYSSSNAPGLAALGSTLFMAYQNSSGQLKVVGTSNPQSSNDWKDASSYTVADSISGGPAMVAWNNTLYLVARVSGKTINVYTSVDGINWSAGIAIYEDLRDPSITVFNGMLYIACRDGSNNVWICSSADGSTWSGFTQLSAELSAVQSAQAPALAALGTSTSEQLVLAYIDTSTSGNNLHTVSAVMSFS